MEKDRSMRASERMLFLFAPKAAAARYTKRLKKQHFEEGASPKTGGNIRMAGGYANHGASYNLNALKGWITSGGSAEEDIDLTAATLRERARDLYTGGGLGRSAPATLTTNVIAWGVKCKPKIDADALGMSVEAADQWERTTMREFALWAENVYCDAARQHDFYQLQRLAFLNMLMSGDCFVLFGEKENRRTPYSLTLRLIEADRVSTPESNGQSTSEALESGGRIIDGVEVDAEGAVVRYHIANKHPLSDDTADIEWVSIEAFGSETGEPNILQIASMERPEQHRGIPFVAAEIESIKQLDRYVKSELLANVVSSMLTTFITSDMDDGQLGIEDSVSQEEKIDNSELNIEMAAGAVYELPPGKKPVAINPMRSNTVFNDYTNQMATLTGAGLEIPKEVLVKKYESNYTAARAALLDFWRVVRIRRSAFNSAFNQPVYEAWLAQAVATGRIKAPGFFDAPEKRKAWSGAMWLGASMGHVDPLKEINAAAQRIALNISTQEQEASEYNGGNWEENVRQRLKEMSIMAQTGTDNKGDDKT